MGPAEPGAAPRWGAWGARRAGGAGRARALGPGSVLWRRPRLCAEVGVRPRLGLDFRGKLSPSPLGVGLAVAFSVVLRYVEEVLFLVCSFFFFFLFFSHESVLSFVRCNSCVC